MSIRKVSVQNFRSFDSLEVELGDFNVLIGSNASGKSNFVQIFKFLRDMVTYDLENAISMQGGVEYFRNLRLGNDADSEIEVVMDQKLNRALPTDEGYVSMEVYETSHKLVLQFMKRARKLKSLKEFVTLKCEFRKLERKGKGNNTKFETKELYGEGQVTITNNDGKISIDLDLPQEVKIDKEDIFPSFFLTDKLPRATVLPAIFFLFLPPLHEMFSDIAVYDFDPKLPKRATPITGKADLEEDGSNLALVLKDIIEDKTKKRKFANLIAELLPFVQDLGTERFADKSLLFKLKEAYNPDEYIPASLISDGTINVAALVVALYFEDKALTIIEEPEKGIHPYIISRLVNVMQDASTENQVLITTHNPEVVKYAGIENLLLVTRGLDGYSRIQRPSHQDELRQFLGDELGIEELYVQNLLTV